MIGGSIGAGACANVKRNAKIYKIDDDTKMLHLLSEKDGEDNDWLFIVIEDIVSSIIKFSSATGDIIINFADIHF